MTGDDQTAPRLPDGEPLPGALPQGEQRFQALVESSQYGILAYDAELRLTAWNPAMELISGVPCEEVLGRPAPEAFPFLDQVGETEAFRSAIAGRPTMHPRVPYRVPHTGRSGYFESSHFPLRDADGRTVGGMAMVRDVTERVETEEARWAAEQKYRLISERATDMIFLLTADDLVFLYANPATFRVLGCEEEDLIGRSLSVILHPDDVGRAEQAFGAAAEPPGGGASPDGVELRFRRKDGTCVWVAAVAGAPVADGGLRGVLVISRDVTARKAAEAEVRAERDRLQTYLDVAGVMVVVLDTAGRVVLINRRGCEALGRLESEIVGRDWFAHFLPERARADVRAAFDVLMGGELEPIEYFENPVLAADGTERLIAWHNAILRDEDGRILGTLSSGADVTERRTSADALRESEARYRALVEDMPALICRFQTDGTLSFVNDAYCRYFGRSPDELIGQDFFQFIPEGDRAQVRDHYTGLTSGAPVVSYEHPVLDPDGNLRYQRWIDRLLCDAEGNALEYQSMGMDITDRRRAEDAVRLSNVLLGIANRQTGVGPLLQECVEEVKRFMGCAAVGMRMLEEDGSIPYQAYDGFSPEFYELENALSAEHDQCFCSRVVTGQADPDSPAWTAAGSLCLNGASRFLAEMTPAQRVGLRCTCMQFGYESLALVPIRLGDRVLGLIQVADTGEGMVPPDKVAMLEAAALALGPAMLRLRAEEELQRELEVSSSLAELSNALITAALSIKDIAGTVLECAKALTGSDHGYVSSIEPETGDNVSHTLTLMMGRDCQVTGDGRRIAFPMGPDGRYPALWGHALNTREAFFCNEPPHHLAAKGLPAGHVPISSFLTVPAVVGDELVGQVALANAPGGYKDRDLEAIRRLTELYALAVQRRRAEDALRESEERYHSLYASMSEGVALHEIVYDEAGRAVDYVILEVNPAFEAITGLSRERAAGKRASELYGAQEPPHLSTYARVVETGRPESFEAEFANRNRHVRISVFSPARGRFATVIADITRRRRMERALRLARDRLEKRVAARTAELSAANEALRTEVAERQRVAQQLLVHQERLRSMASELQATEDRERRRIAADLHDRIGQALAVSKIKLGQIQQEAAAAELTGPLRELRELIDQTIRDTRTVTFELSPPVLYELGLDAAIEWLAEDLQSQHGLEVTIDAHGGRLDVGEDVGSLLFRAVRELLLNTVKHARARTAHVALRPDDGHLTITVEDDGVGFDAARLRPETGRGSGYGLFSIRERLDHLGGSLKIESEPGRGTRAVLTVPAALGATDEHPDPAGG